MAEYMDYNDVDGEKTKKQKIRSRVAVTLSVLWLVFLVVWVIIRLPHNVRTDFEAIASNNHKVGESVSQENNEFLKLKKEFDADKSYTLNADFDKNYPDVYDMLKLTKTEISKNKVLSFDSDSCFTLAIPYVVSLESNSADNSNIDDSGEIVGIVGIDFIIVPYDSAVGSITIDAPIKYSLRFCNRSSDTIPYVEGEYVESSSFRLNFYSLSLGITSVSDINQLIYEANLSEPLNSSESKNNKIGKNINLKNSDITAKYVLGNHKADEKLSYSYALPKGTKAVTMVIDFNDLMYNKFKNICLSLPDNDSHFTITAN